MLDLYLSVQLLARARKLDIEQILRTNENKRTITKMSIWCKCFPFHLKLPWKYLRISTTIFFFFNTEWLLTVINYQSLAFHFFFQLLCDNAVATKSPQQVINLFSSFIFFLPSFFCQSTSFAVLTYAIYPSAIFIAIINITVLFRNLGRWSDENWNLPRMKKSSHCTKNCKMLKFKSSKTWRCARIYIDWRCWERKRSSAVT